MTTRALTPAPDPTLVVAHPFVKIAGGKRKLLPLLREHVPGGFYRPQFKSTATYFEPFVGGGALFFDLEYPRCVLGDTCTPLVTAYRTIRDSVTTVITLLSALSGSNDKESYYRIRERNFEVGTEAERAAEFLYANRVCFNGLFRVNKSGRFNVPFGDNPKATICDEDNLRAVSRRLQGVELRQADFASAVADAREGDFVYFDPPYAPISKTSNFTGYSSGGFTDKDQERLRDLLLDLKWARGVHVVLSNSSAPLVRDLYGDPAQFTIHEVRAARSINSKATKRGDVTELVIT
jgi:DNA adenine methylase